MPAGAPVPSLVYWLRKRSSSQRIYPLTWTDVLIIATAQVLKVVLFVWSFLCLSKVQKMHVCGDSAQISFLFFHRPLSSLASCMFKLPPHWLHPSVQKATSIFSIEFTGNLNSSTSCICLKVHTQQHPGFFLGTRESESFQKLADSSWDTVTTMNGIKCWKRVPKSIAGVNCWVWQTVTLPAAGSELSG